MVSETTEIQRFHVRIQKGADSVLVFPFGTYYRDGEKREFTPEGGAEMVKNFVSDLLERQPPVNLEHERAKGRVGYVRRLWVADDGVHGEIEPVKGNEDTLGRFDYVSPEIRWSWQHPFTNNKHHNVLMGLALTNYPYLLGRMSLHSTADVWTGSEWEPVTVSTMSDADLVALHERLQEQEECPTT